MIIILKNRVRGSGVNKTAWLDRGETLNKIMTAVCIKRFGMHVAWHCMSNATEQYGW